MPGVAVAVAVAALALLATGCGLYKDQPYPVATPTATATNLLRNPGFEDTTAWTASEQGAFSVSGEQRRSGGESGELRGTNKSVAVSQPLADGTVIPEFVSGFYRLDAWKPKTDGEIGFRVTVRAGGADFIIHFAAGGLQEAPGGLPGNEKYVFLTRAAPATGAWTYFGYPVAAAFRDRYGLAATGVQGVAVALELRGDGTQAWFDDLYAGSQVGNPNRPGG